MNLESARLQAKEALLEAEQEKKMALLTPQALRLLLEEVNANRALVQNAEDRVRKLRAELVQLEFSSIHPTRSPTHRCKICGAFWILYRDHWSLCSKRCGKCCDNERMVHFQLESLHTTDLVRPVETPDLDEEPAAARYTPEQVYKALADACAQSSRAEVAEKLGLTHPEALHAFLDRSALTPGTTLTQALGLEVVYEGAPRAQWFRK